MIPIQFLLDVLGPLWPSKRPFGADKSSFGGPMSAIMVPSGSNSHDIDVAQSHKWFYNVLDIARVSWRADEHFFL